MNDFDIFPITFDSFWCFRAFLKGLKILKVLFWSENWKILENFSRIFQKKFIVTSGLTQDKELDK